MRYNKIILCSLLLLVGCSGFSLKDNLSDAAGVGVGTVVAAAVNPVVGATVGLGTSIAVNSVTQPEEVNLAQVTNVHQEKVAETQIIAETVESLGIIGVTGAIAAFIIIPWIIGRLTPRRREIELAAREDERKRRAEARSD